MTAADLVITDLADGEALAQHQSVALAADSEVYRLIAQQAIHALAERERHVARLREQIRALRVELRRETAEAKRLRAFLVKVA